MRRRAIGALSPRERERDLLSFDDGEVGVNVAGVDLDGPGGVEPEPPIAVPTGHDGETFVVDTFEPGDGAPISGPGPKQRAHRDLPLHPGHNADDLRRFVARDHEIGDLHRAGLGGPLRFQDHRVTHVPADRDGRGDAIREDGGSDLPKAVLGGAEETGEDSSRVEPRQAQPVDAAIQADQSRAPLVAEQAVVLDPPRTAVHPWCSGGHTQAETPGLAPVHEQPVGKKRPAHPRHPTRAEAMPMGEQSHGQWCASPVAPGADSVTDLPHELPVLRVRLVRAQAPSRPAARYGDLAVRVQLTQHSSGHLHRLAYTVRQFLNRWQRLAVRVLPDEAP
mgnify:CR=1 FL=1